GSASRSAEVMAWDSSSRSAGYTPPARRPAPSPAQPVSRQGRDRQHELAELLSPLHPFLCGGGLFEGEGAVDHRLEDARAQQAGDLLPVVSGAHGGAVDRDLLAEDPPDILLRLGAAGGPAGNQPPAPGQGADA